MLRDFDSDLLASSALSDHDGFGKSISISGNIAVVQVFFGVLAKAYLLYTADQCILKVPVVILQHVWAKQTRISFHRPILILRRLDNLLRSLYN
jgi:ABC-type anion transport system duplicated permease subunit